MNNVKSDCRELHPNRLSTTDDTGKRIYLHQKDVKGFFRTRRTIFYWFLIIIYLIIPWIEFENNPLIYLDLPTRQFIFFGNVFFGHDAPYLFFIFIAFALVIGLVTAIWGRIWCGWACPQTVFIDAIYRKIELLIEGDHRLREKLENANWNFEKIIKRTVKWFLYILVSLVLSNTFLAYFTGAEKLLKMMMSSPTENWISFLVMLTTFLIFLFNFAWFREQFCIIACPYGRFQSVFMDEHSLSVSYDHKRGEPRRGVDQEKEGDCVNCFECVKVCPTGIDIRRGTQLECIACTACIDACDRIMERVKRPQGLIRYESEIIFEGKEVQHLRLRTILYSLLLFLVLISFIISLNNRNDISAVFIRSRMPYQDIIINSKRFIINHFRVAITNQSDFAQKIWFSSDLYKNTKQMEFITPIIPFELNPLAKKEAILFIKFPFDILELGTANINVLIKTGDVEDNSKVQQTQEVKLVGPF